jgi:hypothetical protein
VPPVRMSIATILTQFELFYGCFSGNLFNE